MVRRSSVSSTNRLHNLTFRCESLTVQNVKGLTDQFVWYKNWQAEVISVAGPERGKYIISNALHAFSTGSNDWVNNYYLNPNLMSKYTPTTYTTLLLQQVRNYVQVRNTILSYFRFVETSKPWGFFH